MRRKTTVDRVFETTFLPSFLEGSNFQKAKEFTKVFYLCLWRGMSAKWGINRLKTPQNHSRQHRKTKFSELYLSDYH